NIDTLNEKFEAEAFIEAEWFDTKFPADAQNYDVQVHWNPKLSVDNSIGELKDERYYTINRSSPANDGGHITEHRKIKGVFWEKLELHDFPFDVQDLTIKVTSDYLAEDIALKENFDRPSSINRRAFTAQQEWSLFEHVEVSHQFVVA
ncbi:unnamed protein product, partial [Didymodactylos carnosus]